jgi:transposase InsO family protein
MTGNELTIHYKISLLECAKKHNVSAACRIFRISRTRYYQIQNQFLKYGLDGLYPRPKIPRMPNKIRGNTEREILDFVKIYPTYGPARIANELMSSTGGRISYSSVGIWCMLKRNGLNRKKDRLYRSYLSGESAVTLEDMSRLERPELHVETSHTGQLVSQDSFKLGYIKGIGAIYTQAAIDCDCSFAFAKLYKRKTADTSVDLLKKKVLPFYRAYCINLERILTDNGKEYTTHSIKGRDGHKYEKYLKKAGITHTLTRVRSPETNGYIERFHRTLLDEFFLIAIRNKLYRSLEELQADLDRFMVKYNWYRTHQGYKVGGVPPINKFVSGIFRPLALESKT